MRTLLFYCLTLPSYSWSNESENIHNLLKRTSIGDETAFTNEYLKESFALTLHLFPYVRTENVQELFAVPEKSSLRKGSITIKR